MQAQAISPTRVMLCSILQRTGIDALSMTSSVLCPRVPQDPFQSKNRRGEVREATQQRLPIERTDWQTGAYLYYKLKHEQKTHLNSRL